MAVLGSGHGGGGRDGVGGSEGESQSLMRYRTSSVDLTSVRSSCPPSAAATGPTAGLRKRSRVDKRKNGAENSQLPTQTQLILLHRVQGRPWRIGWAWFCVNKTHQ